MAAGKYSFIIEQGATFTRTFKYKTSGGAPIDLSSHSIRMDIRSSVDSPTTIIALNKSTSTDQDSTIAVGGDGNNEIIVTISNADTADMSFSTAVYDLEIESLGVVTRILQGKIRLSKEVTRST